MTDETREQRRQREALWDELRSLGERIDGLDEEAAARHADVDHLMGVVEEQRQRLATLEARLAAMERKDVQHTANIEWLSERVRDHGATEAANLTACTSKASAAPDGASSVQPSPAPREPSDDAITAGMTAYFGDTLSPTYDLNPDEDNWSQYKKGLRAAYTVDVPAIERAAYERGVRDVMAWEAEQVVFALSGKLRLKDDTMATRTELAERFLAEGGAA